VSSFFPDGYVPTPQAILEVAEKWFEQRLREVETLVASELASNAEPKSGVEALARALSRPPIPAPLLHKDIVPQTVVRLRNHLFDGKLLTVYYFGGLLDGCHEIRPGFWTTPAADGVLESGTYFPLGKPDRWYDRRLSCPIFFNRAELDALPSLQNPAPPQTPAEPNDPPGPKPGRQTPKDRASKAVLSILNDSAKRPIPGHGRRTELARMVCTDLQNQGQSYQENSVQKMIRGTVTDWEAKNPDK
jgi:hypothetical protein